MNCFTSTISVPLAEKLKEKGMPIRIDHDTERTDATYGACFDWLMEKGVYISGFRRFDRWRWEHATEWRFRIEREDMREEVNGSMVNGNTWHEAAEKAIEKALELL